jgi:hypothetical protein
LLAEENSNLLSFQVFITQRRENEINMERNAEVRRQIKRTEKVY